MNQEPSGVNQNPSNSSGGSFKYAIVEDQVLFRNMVIRELTRLRPHYECVYSGDDLAAYLALGTAADMLILDLSLHGQPPDTPRVSAIIAQGTSVLIVSELADHRVALEMESLGVKSLLSKERDEATFMEAIDTVIHGDEWTGADLAAILAANALPVERDEDPDLSKQQRRVMALLAKGLTRGQIGTKLGISEDTVDTHIRRLREKYRAVGVDLGTTGAIAAEATRRGFNDHDAGVVP